ncbi:MAG: hypothetical protein MZU97_13425 [Bacillus subtilis]|nr:hypothetical protein [Bacillus subtilis]
MSRYHLCSGLRRRSKSLTRTKRTGLASLESGIGIRVDLVAPSPDSLDAAHPLAFASI